MFKGATTVSTCTLVSAFTVSAVAYTLSGSQIMVVDSVVDVHPPYVEFMTDPSVPAGFATELLRAVGMTRSECSTLVSGAVSTELFPTVGRLCLCSVVVVPVPAHA